MKKLDLIPSEQWDDRVVTKEAQKRIIKKGKSYSVHNLVYHLVNLDDEKKLVHRDLGLVYSSLVLNFPKNCYVSQLDHHSSGELVRSFKKKFQDLTRVGVYRLYQHLRLSRDVNDFSSLENFYQEKMLEKVYNPISDNEHALESQIANLMKNEGFMDDNLHAKIGKALEFGARNFYSEFKTTHNDPKFHEYNKILESIGEILR